MGIGRYNSGEWSDYDDGGGAVVFEGNYAERIGLDTRTRTNAPIPIPPYHPKSPESPMNLTNIKITPDLKISENLWVLSDQFIANPNRKYWVYVPDFPRGPVVKVEGAVKPYSTLLQWRGVRYKVTHTWTGVAKPEYGPAGNKL